MLMAESWLATLRQYVTAILLLVSLEETFLSHQSPSELVSVPQAVDLSLSWSVLVRDEW